MDARLPAAELAVLESLWQRGAATIRELTDALYAGGSTAEYATVQKLVERLESKGFVRRDRSAFAHQVMPTVERGQIIDQQLREVAARLCDGSLTPLLTHLVEGASLSKRERDQLRALIDASEQKPRRRNRK